MSARVTIINSEVPETLTKRYYLANGEVQKKTCGQMVEGFAEVVRVSGVEEFAEVLAGLKNNQALCFGVPKAIKEQGKIRIVPESEKSDGVIARTKKDFEFDLGAGVMFLDHDDDMDREQLIETIVSVMPELQTVDKIWLPSSSSFIFNGKEQVTGLKGQRLYFFVDNAEDIPRIGETLYQRLWLAGHGRIQISAAGSMLERAIVDASVWQCNRLDFASGADCVKPLVQKRGEPMILKGCRKMLETARVKSLTGKQVFLYREAVGKAKAELKGEADKIQTAHIETRLKKVPQEKREDMRKVYREAYNCKLAGDFEITLFKDGQRMTKTVLEILSDREQFNFCKTLDPIEPEYNNEHKTGKLYLDGSKPLLDSKAHGGAKYYLLERIEKSKTEKIFDEMQEDVKAQLAGKVYTIPLPWRRLSLGTNALREGTVTVICGATKVGKSFFSMNIVKELHENNVNWAYLPLEDGIKEWTWRIMAILENDFTMVADNPETAERRAEVMRKRKEEITAYIENVTQNPRIEPIIVNGKKKRKNVTSELVLNWAEEQCKNGKRVVFIDPLAQISFAGFKKWEAEEAFVQDICGIAADYGSSIVIVSHTKKGNSDETLSVEDMQGSAAFGRLCQTSILIGATNEMIEVDINRPGGEIEKAMSNRTVVIGAARNGAGTRSKLAYVVEPGSPIFNEIGYLSTKRKQK